MQGAPRQLFVAVVLLSLSPQQGAYRQYGWAVVLNRWGRHLDVHKAILNCSMYGGTIAHLRHGTIAHLRHATGCTRLGRGLLRSWQQLSRAALNVPQDC